MSFGHVIILSEEVIISYKTDIKYD